MMGMAPVNAPIAYKLYGMFGVADDKVESGLFFAGLYHRVRRGCMACLEYEEWQVRTYVASLVKNRKEVHFFICSSGFLDSVTISKMTSTTLNENESRRWERRMEKGDGGREREAGGEGRIKENAGVGGRGKEGRDGIEKKRV